MTGSRTGFTTVFTARRRHGPQTLHGTAIYADQLGWCQGGQCRHIFQFHGVYGDWQLSNLTALTATATNPPTTALGRPLIVALDISDD